MDSRIVDDKIEVRNVVAVQPGWLFAPVRSPGWAKGEYYFNCEPIIAWGTTVISGKRLGTKNNEPWKDPDVHPITVERRADAFPGPWAVKLPLKCTVAVVCCNIGARQPADAHQNRGCGRCRGNHCPGLKSCVNHHLRIGQQRLDRRPCGWGPMSALVQCARPRARLRGLEVTAALPACVRG
jgi:hypothetical protein